MPRLLGTGDTESEWREREECEERSLVRGHESDTGPGSEPGCEERDTRGVFRLDTQGETVIGAGEWLSGGSSSEGSRHGDPGSSWSGKIQKILTRSRYLSFCLVCLVYFKNA